MSAAPVKVLYVLGRGRTGSTLLGNILAQTPGIVHVGELLTLWNIGLRENGRLCGCGEPVLTCAFWREVAGEVLGPNWTAEDVERVERLRRAHVRGRQMPRRLLSSPRARRARGEGLGVDASYADVVEHLYRATARVAAAGVVVDSSKSATMAAFLPSVPGIELFYVNLVRDPRAIAFSQMRQKALPSGVMDAMAGALTSTYPPHRTAEQWMERQLVAEVTLGRHPRSHRTVLRYEDLVTEPQATVDRLRWMLGLPAAHLPFVDARPTEEDPAAPTTGVRLLEMAATHTVGGNPSRVASGPLPIALDDRWRIELPPSAHRTVTAITAPLLGRYGYPVRRKDA